MYIITYHCSPRKANDKKKVEGAYVNCFIKTRSLVKAKAISLSGIEKNEWDVIEEDQISVIGNYSYEKDSVNYGYYKQALEDGEVFVYHTYPKRKK